MKKSLLSFLLVLSVVVFGGFVGSALLGPNKTAKGANALIFSSTNILLPQTNKDFANPFASTSVFFLQPGLGTTSIAVNTSQADQLALNILFRASTTPATLKWRYEYSSNGVDWYADDGFLATSTITSVVPAFSEYSWTFSTSTQGPAGSDTGTTGFKHIQLLNIASPMVRAVFYLPAGSSNGAINVQTITKVYNAI